MSRVLFALLSVAALGAQAAFLHGLQRAALQTHDYYSYEKMLDYLDGLAHTYPSRVTLEDWGRTHENRTLRSITITNGYGRRDKKVIFIDAAFHAREWLTPAAALYAIDQLVVGFELNKELLQDYDWIVLPLVNPDGYTFSRTIDPRWRKNRSPNRLGCHGTDLNRNFAVGWGGASTSKNPCSHEKYCGRAAFSEPESRAVRQIMHHLMATERGILYISIHSHGSWILYPWSYAKIAAKNTQEHAEIAQAGVAAVVNAPFDSSTKYKAKASHELYPAGGTSTDYAYSIGFPLAYTLELPGRRGNATFNFHPPRHLISELVQETWIGLRAMAEKTIEKCSKSKRKLHHKNIC
ncbi:carboxypeptidase B-like [Drosophila madeirensis]|uniref:Carboxypeptidase B-like n=1 Tax=Drosophila madeirensis TaxID=30013 RepID=A0AAU9FQ44_DROMD